jgi:hypothetical protein
MIVIILRHVLVGGLDDLFTLMLLREGGSFGVGKRSRER